jgi:protein-tyrosine phosphatase
VSSTTARPEDLANLRDVGGLPTVDGRRTRPGVLWRSDAPLAGDVTLGPDGHGWPPGSVVDLRHAAELPAPHPLPAVGSTLTTLPVMDALAPDDRARGHDGSLPIAELYLRMLDIAEAWLPELVAVAAHGPAPVLVHCAAGKDRTGVSVALLLRIAGVTREAILADFAETNRHFAPLLERLVAQGRVDRDVDHRMIGVVPADLEAVLDRLEPDPWDLPRAAGVPESDLVAWRDRLLGAT